MGRRQGHVEPSDGDPMMAYKTVPGSRRPADIVERFQLLKYIRHPALCQYVDVFHGRHDRLHVVLEHHATTLEARLAASAGGLPVDQLRRASVDVLSGLAFLHAQVHARRVHARRCAAGFAPTGRPRSCGEILWSAPRVAME